MTPAQLDHLRRIDAHLANLLLTAEKRTSGEWRVYESERKYPCPGIESNGQSIVVIGTYEDDAGVRTGIKDAAFISSCAGNAEAGWRATRLAIKTLLEYTGPLTPQIEREYAKEKLGEIIALFPNV